VLAAVFFVISTVFVYRSFYSMRIGSGLADEKSSTSASPGVA
jgi:K(+)-stimulated pyrophosphate-energized sodium pump